MKLHTMPVGRLATNCYILASAEGGCAIIDPGAQPEKIAQLIREHGYAVRHILITHGHHDHIGGVKYLAEQFPDATVSISSGDLDKLEDAQKSLAEYRSPTPGEFIYPGANTLHDGDIVELDELYISVIETPGHTKGGLCFAVGNHLFTGDTLFRDDVGRCDLPCSSYPAMKRSLAKLCELVGDYEVYPGHGESSTLEYERRNNMYILEPMPAD